MIREIHMVHMSHHDIGYTDLPSNVLERHCEWYDAVLDDMDERDNYPEDVRLRITVEQFWSLDYYLKHTSERNRDRIKERIKKGDIELTALYGNLTTEQLGHEEMYKAMYDATKLALECGVEITSANHNDIPGAAWGMCRSLCDAGVKIIAADFPKYYNWGHRGLRSFWDTKGVYGYEGPGVCYWRAQDGKKLLLWNSDVTIMSSWDEKSIEDICKKLEECNYPFDVFRVTVKSGNIDNTRYITDFADNALKWNEKKTQPRIIMSTNERFRDALEKNAKEKNIVIPEISGEIHGQDYPVGSMSMADITSTARKTQNKITATEKLCALVSDDQKFKDCSDLIHGVWTDLLLADDHAYGFQFPAGPAMKASYWEKGVYAMRAEANAHDVFDKAFASITDRIASQGTGLRLAVFNPSGNKGSRVVEAPLREFDNCGTILCQSNDEPDKLKGYNLNDRRRVNPETCIWDKEEFDLIDMQSGKKVPYYIEDLNWDDPEYFAPERYGLGSGTKRYGFFEEPGGMKKILRFIADDMPAFGYRCYALVEKSEKGSIERPKAAECIDNGIYKIEVDSKGICSIIDLRSNTQLVDKESEYRIGDILVRNGRSNKTDVMMIKNIEVRQNELYGEITLFACIDGAHEVSVRFMLWKGIDKIDVSVHMLKSAKPLQSMFVAFPFIGKGFKYQGVLSDTEPVRNTVAGAHSDFLTVRDYVRVNESDILWNTTDTAVVALGKLWDGYISPAHSCIMEREDHIPLTENDFNNSGHIYAMLCANNFGTNFMCSQTFDGVYKFSFTRKENGDSVSDAAWGECEQNPVVTQFTDRSRGDLPPVASLLDTGALHCLALKKSEDRNGYIIRLWNHSDKPELIKVSVNGQNITEFYLCDAVERVKGKFEKNVINPKEVLTLKFDLN